MDNIQNTNIDNNTTEDKMRHCCADILEVLTKYGLCCDIIRDKNFNKMVIYINGEN